MATSIDTTTKSAGKRSQDRPTSSTRVGYLHHILNCARPQDGGARYLLSDVQTAFLGRGDARNAVRERRGSTFQLTLELDGELVSRSHASLTRSPSGGWTIDDDGSRNGTRLNGRPVAGPTEVLPGAIIQVADHFLMLGELVVRQGDEVPGDAVATDVAGQVGLPGFPTLSASLDADLLSLRPVLGTKNPIVIVGETGTGKGLLARAIHEASGRPGPFVVVNCPELSAGLVEGQLFGFTRGAYTGAQGSDPGLIQSSDHGTLFIDEIVDLPLIVQAKLLRVLQEREIVPLGTSKPRSVDTRFIAATQIRLSDLVTAGRFREDLQHRLERRVLELPPLRRRREDLGMLLAMVLKQNGVQKKDAVTLPWEAATRLLTYAWSGNVREFENKVGEAFDRRRDGVLALDAFPEPKSEKETAALSSEDQQQRDAMESLLKKHGGNVTAVAQELGNKHREVIYRQLRRLGLDAKKFR
jgi:transcriptional regulator of acetoin/glycerol metabolism